MGGPMQSTAEAPDNASSVCDLVISQNAAGNILVSYDRASKPGKIILTFQLGPEPAANS